MDFVKDLADTSNVPEFAVGGFARAEIIDGAIVRVTLFKPQPAHFVGPHVPALELIWTVTAWLAARAELHQVATEITRIGLDRPPRQAGDVGMSHH